LKAAGVPMLGYGQFLTALVNFLILAFIIFLLVLWANRLMKKPEAAPTPEDVLLLREIRDSLKSRP
jgi:large conductance mechanosensitive channel